MQVTHLCDEFYGVQRELNKPVRLYGLSHDYNNCTVNILILNDILDCYHMTRYLNRTFRYLVATILVKSVGHLNIYRR